MSYQYPSDPRSGVPMTPPAAPQYGASMAPDPRYGAPATWSPAPAQVPQPVPMPLQLSPSFDRQAAEYLAMNLTPEQLAVLLRAYAQMTTDLHAGNQYTPGSVEQPQMSFFLQHHLLAMHTNGYVVTPLALLVISTAMQLRLMAMR